VAVRKTLLLTPWHETGGRITMVAVGTLRAIVRGGRAVLLEDRVDYPDGTELELDVHEADNLDEAERAERDAAIEASYAAMTAGGRMYSAEEVLARLRASK